MLPLALGCEAPYQKIGPLTEPNEAMATKAPMEMWFSLEKLMSRELASGDGGDQ
jgi:hypothetical protein